MKKATNKLKQEFPEYGKGFNPAREIRKAGDISRYREFRYKPEQAVKSRRDRALERSLQTLSGNRRRSIQLRELFRYSDAEIRAAIKLDPQNKEFNDEAARRHLVLT